jgi:fermentation-respiration switch protein FrsA (DUF1100 family)
VDKTVDDVDKFGGGFMKSPTVGLKPVLLSGLRIATIAYFALMAMLFFFQSHFVYFPERGYVDTPNNFGLACEAVSFKTADGIRLTGWFVPTASPRGAVLFCHGNGGNISHRIEQIAIMRSLDLDTFIFDYRGYGQSGGKPNEQGTHLDAEAAWAYLTGVKHVAPEKIIILGQSLGGPVAARLAGRHRPGALILESTFTTFRDMAAHLYPYLPARLLVRYNYETVRYIQGVRCPVLIIHSRKDNLILFSLGERLYDAANQPKSLLAITGTHNEGFSTSGRVYIEGIERFLKSSF